MRAAATSSDEAGNDERVRQQHAWAKDFALHEDAVGHSNIYENDS
jgi:hypothetical protein